MSPIQSSSQRFLALDVFRGLTICFMIIVNTNGNNETFSPLLHANWNGFTPTDLVFPSFLFAVGNALSFVMPKWNNLPASAVVGKILKRTAIIFLLGFLMYWFPFVEYDANNEIIFKPLAQTRILGVLQRIALAYGLAALMFYFLKPRLTLIITCIILVGYWIIMYGFGDAADPYSIAGNAGTKLDLFLMNPAHHYHGEGFAFEPEGWLGTLPAIGNVVGGFFAGRLIQQKGKTYETLSKLMLTGFLLIFLAYAWNLSFPVNKKLWTSSFVLLTVGIDCVLISAVIYVIDFLKKTWWTYFFEVFGRNPLIIYLISELLAILLWFFRVDGQTPLYIWVYNTIFSHAGPYLGSLLFALSFMLICWLAGWWMDKKKIYIKV